MPKTIACVHVLLVLASFAGAPARAQDNPAPVARSPELEGLTPEDARRLVAILADGSRRAELMESLRKIAASGPSEAPSPSQPTAPTSPARPSLDVLSLGVIERELATMRQKVEQLAAGQAQMARDIAKGSSVNN
jgi:hypothetical protein